MDRYLSRPRLFVGYASVSKSAGSKSQGEPDEDVDDGEVYQDDYADILVEEAEGRYKDILDYRDYEYVDDRWNNDWDDDAPSDDAVATH